MKTFLNLLLSLLVVIAVWRVALHSPSPLVSAQGPGADDATEKRPAAGDDPFGGPTAPGDPFGGAPAPGDPFGGSAAGDDPFGGAPAADDPFGGPATGGGNDSRPRGQDRGDAAGGSGPADANAEAWLQPYVQEFRVELIDVADDRQSVLKGEVRGAAWVKPVSRNELPDVHVDQIFEVKGLGLKDAQPGDMYEGGDMYGGGKEMYGGGDMYEGEGMGMGDGRSDPSWRALDERQREDVVQRVTWQAQADWVRRVIGSRSAPDEAEKESLKNAVREVLKKQYMNQLRRQAVAVQVVERRVIALRQSLAQRAEASDRVVEFELQRMELEAAGMSLGADVGLEPTESQRSGSGTMMGMEGGMF